jgi:K+/H+ antiporter YhaU regulatory subunit KhtT
VLIWGSGVDVDRGMGIGEGRDRNRKGELTRASIIAIGDTEELLLMPEPARTVLIVACRRAQ